MVDAVGLRGYNLLNFSDIIIGAYVEGFLGILCVVLEVLIGYKKKPNTNSNKKQTKIVVESDVKAKKIIGGDYRSSDENNITGNVDRKSEIYIKSPNGSEIDCIVGGNYTNK